MIKNYIDRARETYNFLGKLITNRRQETFHQSLINYNRINWIIRRHTLTKYILLRFRYVARKPALFRGIKCWTLGEEYERRTDAVQMRFLRPLPGARGILDQS